jgi:hypothetical protein
MQKVHTCALYGGIMGLLAKIRNMFAKQQLSFDNFKLIFRTGRDGDKDIYRFLIEGKEAEVAFGCEDAEELLAQLNRVLQSASKNYATDALLLKNLIDGLNKAYLMSSFDVEYNKTHKKPWRFKSSNTSLDSLYLSNTVLFCDETVDGLIRKLEDARLLIASKK